MSSITLMAGFSSDQFTNAELRSIKNGNQRSLKLQERSHISYSASDYSGFLKAKQTFIRDLSEGGHSPGERQLAAKNMKQYELYVHTHLSIPAKFLTVFIDNAYKISKPGDSEHPFFKARKEFKIAESKYEELAKTPSSFHWPYPIVTIDEKIQTFKAQRDALTNEIKSLSKEIRDLTSQVQNRDKALQQTAKDISVLENLVPNKVAKKISPNKLKLYSVSAKKLRSKRKLEYDLKIAKENAEKEIEKCSKKIKKLAKKIGAFDYSNLHITEEIMSDINNMKNREGTLGKEIKNLEKFKKKFEPEDVESAQVTPSFEFEIHLQAGSKNVSVIDLIYDYQKHLKAFREGSGKKLKQASWNREISEDYQKILNAALALDRVILNETYRAQITLNLESPYASLFNEAFYGKNYIGAFFRLIEDYNKFVPYTGASIKNRYDKSLEKFIEDVKNLMPKDEQMTFDIYDILRSVGADQENRRKEKSSSSDTEEIFEQVETQEPDILHKNDKEGHKVSDERIESSKKKKKKLRMRNFLHTKHKTNPEK